jgi:EAL domain-containing protein (putative c-di-GMP-specific phosphodiesterase class I)/GGDEF domain-containing protein
MTKPEGARGGPDYRSGYLKMKSALHDRVTGLPSLPLLFDGARAELDRRDAIGVLHVEIVDLAMVESLYGWQVLDGIVALVARRLEACIGDPLPRTTRIALNGVAGDRFVLFVPCREGGEEVDASFLAEIGRDVRNRLERALDDEAMEGLNPGLRPRVGHALLSRNPFYRFERCVYAAVEEARGTQARRERRRELSWGDELRAIIRGGGVRTVFQPVVELATRRVVGHEALSRGPRDSMFETPLAMFALSDRMGIADELDRLCFEAALRASADLEDRGKLFVNLRRMAAPDDRARWETLESALERYGLARSDLVLEFSERTTNGDPGGFIERLHDLKDAGFDVALDDVGTGRTGLRAIESIGPDYLKLDPCLVRNLDESLMQQEVLRTLVRLAERIDGVVIGEGVEREAEAAVLAAGGARLGQGHLFAVPGEARALRRPTGGPPREPER